MNDNEANPSLKSASRRLASLESQVQANRSKAPPIFYPYPDSEMAAHAPNGGYQSFPVYFHDHITKAAREGNSRVVSFTPDGNTICIHNNYEFMAYLAPRYFRQKQHASFQRQLRLYGFNYTEKQKRTLDMERDCYQHAFFKRGRRDLAHQLAM
jgi:hypothetical protein